jgi:spermidine/putrescine transport system permease protein
MNRLGITARRLLSLPLLAVFAVLLLGPLTLLVRYSFAGSQDLTVSFVWTVDSYHAFLAQPAYAWVLGKTIAIAAGISVLALIIGFPAAWFMAQAPERWRGVLLVALAIPWWASFIVRVFAWFTVFGNSGVINRTLDELGLADAPLPLFGFGIPALIVTELNLQLPLMIIPIYMSLERMDWTLLAAARSLGAGWLTIFRRIVLPFGMPGAIAGMMVVFMPVAGSFVVPELVGGIRGLMFGKVIASQFGSASNWPFGAALSVILLLSLLSCLGLMLGLRRRFAAEQFH